MENEFMNPETHFEMAEYKNRLQTFEGWMFKDDSTCSKYAMAKAGFYRPNPEDEPESTMCFACCKELEGWEVDDVPEEEHKKRASCCLFLKFNMEDDKSMFLKDWIELMHFVKKSYVTYMKNRAISALDNRVKEIVQQRIPLMSKLK